MFEQRAVQGSIGSATTLLELIYHSIVRNVRKTHGNALYGLFMNILQTLTLVLAFYFMFTVLGLRGSSVRGDFMLYIMSGIFLYMTHTKGMGAVVGSEGPASPMMQHEPMTTAIAITSSALAALYIQVLSAAVVLTGYHVLVNPIEIADPMGVVGMFLLSWFSGVAVGMVFLAAKPWAPDIIGLVASIYGRANMIASGKMFLANSLPSYMLVYFSWNPLFHTIDQARGYGFINYNPHHSSISYPIYVTLVLLMVGLMGEFFTRKHASLSWSARR
jgi:ABC-type polysaccharide/polyol phosphate export permease